MNRASFGGGSEARDQFQVGSSTFARKRKRGGTGVQRNSAHQLRGSSSPGRSTRFPKAPMPGSSQRVAPRLAEHDHTTPRPVVTCLGLSFLPDVRKAARHLFACIGLVPPSQARMACPPPHWPRAHRAWLRREVSLAMPASPPCPRLLPHRRQHKSLTRTGPLVSAMKIVRLAHGLCHFCKVIRIHRLAAML